MQYKKLKNICSFMTKSKIKAGEGIENGLYPFFTSSDTKVLSLNTYLFDDELIIIGTGGKPSCNYYNGKFAVSTDNFVLKTHQEILPKFLYYFLRKDNLSILQKGFHGAGLQHIGKDYLQEIDIPIMNNEEQISIINSLDRISDLINHKTTKLKKLEELVKSQFIEMFGDVKTNPKQWENVLIRDIGTLVAGATPSTRELKYWENGTIPWMSSGEVNKGKIFETDNKITQLGYDNASTKLVPPNTVVVAMAGQGKTRGTVGITQIELCTNQSICSIVNNSRINPWFLLNYLSLQYQELRNISNGSGGRGGLNLKIIGSFSIYLPPIELQNKFADFVKHIDKLKFCKIITNLKNICYNVFDYKYINFQREVKNV